MASFTDKIKAAIKGDVKEGAKLETGIKLKENNPEHADVSLDNLTGKSIIVGVPGAFTPPCSSQVPGYIQHAQEFATKGVEHIYIVAVNDQFTVNAWKEKLGGGNATNVHFLADDTGAFTKAVGQDFDATGLLGGHRSKRYAFVVEGGIVKKAFIEDEAPNVTVTSAENVLKAI
ncbi:related to peroxisomal membrane protein 20 [Melanopsichium pennsylvanicum]|uniref:Related to peroxisomal membrane protein 20 n=2 Tax=Melanopsichium pennsylvanicum TaxID=63383 RepID=A0AAJ5C5U3_9BASI|nr:related to peroxisomal membrane protein 20 [Melanopsichium pennsylvanicum 4]SNX85096.1 related to peroxisomal membrane protein 20 [Melanopsichium pennsylvanicum]